MSIQFVERPISTSTGRGHQESDECKALLQTARNHKAVVIQMNGVKRSNITSRYRTWLKSRGYRFSYRANDDNISITCWAQRIGKKRKTTTNDETNSAPASAGTPDNKLPF